MKRYGFGDDVTVFHNSTNGRLLLLLFKDQSLKILKHLETRAQLKTDIQVLGVAIVQDVWILPYLFARINLKNINQEDLVNED
ncbi:hypothetical protein M0802_004046 [Mischocyttarus mexicanus]|nr:hypothetical protein M0802_004046 [Mischocyttarus mexicanus]